MWKQADVSGEQYVFSAAQLCSPSAPDRTGYALVKFHQTIVHSVTLWQVSSEKSRNLHNQQIPVQSLSLAIFRRPLEHFD